MNSFAMVALCLVAAQDSPFRDVPDPPPIERRVTTLEAKVATLERKMAGPVTVAPTVKETYEQGLARALATGKPMIVWIGPAVCPACVAANADEFVHHVTDRWHGLDNALVVAMPIDGVMRRIATKLEWPEGHIPTVRQAIAEHRAGAANVATRATPQTFFYPQPQQVRRRN